MDWGFYQNRICKPQVGGSIPLAQQLRFLSGLREQSTLLSLLEPSALHTPLSPSHTLPYLLQRLSAAMDSGGHTASPRPWSNATTAPSLRPMAISWRRYAGGHVMWPSQFQGWLPPKEGPPVNGPLRSKVLGSNSLLIPCSSEGAHSTEYDGSRSGCGLITERARE